MKLRILSLVILSTLTMAASVSANAANGSGSITIVLSDNSGDTGTATFSGSSVNLNTLAPESALYDLYLTQGFTPADLASAGWNQFYDLTGGINSASFTTASVSSTFDSPAISSIDYQFTVGIDSNFTYNLNATGEQATGKLYDDGVAVASSSILKVGETYDWVVIAKGTESVSTGFTVSAVPEPEEYALMLSGLAMLSVTSMRKLKKA